MANGSWLNTYIYQAFAGREASIGGIDQFHKSVSVVTRTSFGIVFATS
jgi:hypothetical protein